MQTEFLLQSPIKSQRKPHSEHLCYFKATQTALANGYFGVEASRKAHYYVCLFTQFHVTPKLWILLK